MREKPPVPGLHPKTPQLIKKWWSVSDADPNPSSITEGVVILGLFGVLPSLVIAGVASEIFTDRIGFIVGTVLLSIASAAFLFLEVIARAVWPYRTVPRGRKHKDLFKDWTSLDPDDQAPLLPLYTKLIRTDEMSDVEDRLWREYVRAVKARKELEYVEPAHIMLTREAVQQANELLEQTRRTRIHGTRNEIL